MSNERLAEIRARMGSYAASIRKLAAATATSQRLDVQLWNDVRDLLAAVDQIAQERDQLKFALSFSEFESRQKLFDLLEKGILELTPDRKLVGGTHDCR